MPPHDVYIEPFLGGGAVMRLKRPARLNIGLDLSEDALRQLASAFPASGSNLVASPNAGRRVTSSSARTGDSTGSLARSGDRLRRPSSVPGLADRLSPLPTFPAGTYRSSEASSYQFLNSDGIEFLAQYAFTGSELVYCDPPYLLATRSRKKLYEHELSDREHRRLLRLLQELPCRVMISGYSSVLYARALKEWNACSFPTMTRGGTERAEWLWYNFERPLALHDYRFLGRDFREREQIKRQKSRWVARLKNMPILKRQALLSALSTIDGFSGADRPAVSGGKVPG